MQAYGAMFLNLSSTVRKLTKIGNLSSTFSKPFVTFALLIAKLIVLGVSDLYLPANNLIVPRFNTPLTKEKIYSSKGEFTVEGPLYKLFT